MFRRLLKMLPAPQIEGYQHPDLIDAIFRKTVAFEPVGASLEMGFPRSVLDFGGGCGVHYKHAQLSNVQWAVVETPAMVARARELQTDKLRFFTEIEEASQWLGEIDVMHSNGALQYTPDPLRTLEKLCTLGARRMIWYRAFLGTIKEMQTSSLQENGPNTVRVKRATLTVERTAVSELAFREAHRGYVLKERGPDWFVFIR